MRCGRESHTRVLMSWGPENMLIRCSKESHHPAEWAPGPPVEHQEDKKDTTLTAISLGSKYCSYVRSPAPSHTQTLSNPFRTLTIKWEVHIFIKKSSASLLLCPYDTAYENITVWFQLIPSNNLYTIIWF